VVSRRWWREGGGGERARGRKAADAGVGGRSGCEREREREGEVVREGERVRERECEKERERECEKEREREYVWMYGCMGFGKMKLLMAIDGG